jgi:hypothetical protein
VHRRERERIMRQGVVLPETARQRRDRQALEQDRLDDPVAERPLRHRYRNFRPDAGAYLASLGGPLPYMSRLREIDARVAQHEAELQEAYEAVAPEAWPDFVRRLDFHELNELIDCHNRWYPVEARLPMDPGTGDYALVNGQRYSKRPLDAHWVLERFPPRPAGSGGSPRG